MRPVILITAIVSGTIAAGFGLTAIFLALAEAYDPIIAAFAVAILLGSISAIALVTDYILSKQKPEMDMSSPAAMIKSAVRSNPIGAISALAALTFIVVRQPVLFTRIAKHVSTLVL